MLSRLDLFYHQYSNAVKIQQRFFFAQSIVQVKGGDEKDVCLCCRLGGEKSKEEVIINQKKLINALWWIRFENLRKQCCGINNWWINNAQINDLVKIVWKLRWHSDVLHNYGLLSDKGSEWLYLELSQDCTGFKMVHIWCINGAALSSFQFVDRGFIYWEFS